MRLVIKSRYASSRSVGTALLLTTLAVVITVFFAASNAYAQDMSHEEEAVRNAYAKLSLMCNLPPLINAGALQVSNIQITPELLTARIANATPVFDLSDFKVGPISEIADRKWSEFNTVPSPGTPILRGHLITQDFNDNGSNTEWKMAAVNWAPAQQENTEALELILSQPISEIIKLAGGQWYDGTAGVTAPITYTRYAAFTVNATFQGRSTGPHKAIFFFGHDAHGKEFVSGNDFKSGASPLYYFSNHPLELSGLLLGKLRETPAVRNWLANNVAPASYCSPDAQAVCCQHGHCGLSPYEFNRDLSIPLSAPKTGGKQ